MAVVTLKSFSDIAPITNSSKRTGHGREDRAWKSMEEALIKGSHLGECKEGPLSLSSSPTPSKAVLLLSSMIFPSADEMVAQAGHIFSVQVLESEETPTQVLATSEREHGEELSITREIDQESPCASNFASNFLDGANIAEFASYMKSPEPHVTSCALSPDDETDHPLGGNITELAPCVNGLEPHVRSIPRGTDQKIPSIMSPHSSTIDCAEHIEDAKSEETSTYIPGVDDHVEHVCTFQQEVSSHSQAATKEMKDSQHVSDDIERVSQVNNVDCQESHSYVSTPPKRTDEAEHPSEVVTTMQVSLHEHLQQDRTGAEEASMRSFIMRRFLPAAQQVAAMEHDSSLTSLASRKQAAVVCPSAQKPERPPIARRIKTRAHQASKGFAARRPLNAMQQEEGMSHSMKSCGFFCLGLRSALFQARRTVSASTRAASRKKSWKSHLSSRVKVADEGSPCIKQDAETMEGSTWHPCASHMYFPPSFLETPQRQAVRHHSNFSDDHSTSIGLSSDICNPHGSQSEQMDVSANTYKQMVCVESPPQSQSEKLDVADAAYEQVVSTDSPLFELVGMASGKNEEAVVEGVAAEAFIIPCNCDHSNVHDDSSAYATTSPLQIHKGRRQAHSCPVQDQAQKNGDEDDGDIESQFFDALSRLNSVRSTASFYTFGSPRSLCENLGLENEWAAKDSSEFMAALSPFETPRASMSEENSVVAQVEQGIHISREPSSLSQRLGKGLKLETCDHLSGSCNHNCPTCTHAHFEDRLMLREGGLQLETFSRMRHRSLDSTCPQDAGTVSPIFPAKCQGSSSLGWPFGISTCHSSRTEMSPDQVLPGKKVEKYVPGLNVLSPPLPPSPKGSWLGNAITRNASKSSPLASLQQKDKVTSARRKLDFFVTNVNAERRWEDVVKGSQIQRGHLRFSEELHQHHPLNHNETQPLRL